ncbi:division/cell wall cluster transcriptional repressor MraZ [Parvularcula oceani]|uniref:division/cell wall cluster transcriptional repressor MraZ n=1 Tax=Parvularcula oceani TaxID=1247963 RepID=UPI0006907611|nr:division/cell wall cluster transcriptional repressor MraZ [Parvularcula oceani]
MEALGTVRQTEEGTRSRDAARFVGRAENKIDAKGRVSVPADFRRALGEAGAPLYALPSLTDPVIECGGEELIGLMLSLIDGMDVYDEERWALEETITEDTQRLSFDDNGRIILPPALREHAGLDGMAAFAGRGQRFVIASPEHLAERRAAARAAASRHRETFKARTLPSVVRRREA